ncbi:MAG: homoaconitate hydratase [Thermoplasmatota archaeon]|nr:homoaconitate hydratase [Candidatus Thermoplasmatota archaeon]MBU1914267.1 homoaconitate hydratase [Candidatus Thermoplasmatota archaeon]
MSTKSGCEKGVRSCVDEGAAGSIFPAHAEARNPILGDICIVDTTCRDGEQMPGISFTMDEKLEIARKLEQMGIEQLETFATYNDSDRKTAELLNEITSRMSIMGWNRMVKADVADSIAHGVDAVSISTDTSDMALEQKLKITRAQQLEKLADCVSFAKGKGVYVCFNAGDATRTSIDYLIEFASVGKKAGGDRFRICDTVGVLTPAKSKRLIRSVMSSVDIDVEFHAHNDFGLAIANALAACEAAAEFKDRKLWVSTTVNGLGERAGNVSLEVFVMNLHSHYGIEKYNAEHILPLCKHVEKASGLGIPLNHPIVGENMFTHKSGIHVDGILKNPSLYEAFDPGMLGITRKIVLGKHSGKASIKHKLDQLGLSASPDAMETMRLEVCRIGETKKRNLTDDEFMAIFQAASGRNVATTDSNVGHGFKRS